MKHHCKGKVQEKRAQVNDVQLDLELESPVSPLCYGKFRDGRLSEDSNEATDPQHCPLMC